MSGSNIVADTSLLINFFNGIEPAKRILNKQHVWVSVITEMELLSYELLSKNDIRLIQSFLDECIVAELTKPIQTLAVSIRKKYKLKLPDAIIAATSIHFGFPLITLDSDFNKVNELYVVAITREE